MRITEIQPQTIGKLKLGTANTLAVLRKNLKTIEKRQNELTKRAAAKEENISVVLRELETLKRAALLNSIQKDDSPLGVLLSARIALIGKQTLANSEDITIRQKRELLKEIQALLATLQSMCKHQLVVETEAPYSGSYSMDHDDWHYGHRICAICGFGENSTSDSKEDYKIMCTDAERIIAWAPILDKTDLVRTTERNRHQVNLWLPIEYIIDCFTDQAVAKLLSL